MKLARINAHNVVGARDIDISLTTPVALIAGGNGAGKSSLAEAVRMALAGEVVRVGLKKEYPQLLTDGAKVGEVSVTIADGDVYGMALPSGKGNALAGHAALLYVLDPTRFATASTDERRALLFAMAGVAIDRASISTRLADRGAPAAMVERVLPLLRAGFPEAAAFASGEARDAKAAWRAVTGETYGEKKADDWAAEAPAADAERVAALAGAMTKQDGLIAEAQAEVGALQERERQHEARASQVALAARLPALRARLERNLAELADWASKVEAAKSRAGTGPRVGLVHELAVNLSRLWESEASKNVAFGIGLDIKSALAHYEREFGKIGAEGDPEAAAFLPRAIEAHALMERTVANDRRDIAAAEAASATTEAAPFSIDELDAERANLAELQRQRRALGVEHEQRASAVRAAAEAQQRTTAAARHHADAQAWGAIAEALSPAGIPGELLGAALEPINARLSASAQATGWKVPVIDADMGITADGRPYRLLSESERWRVDALIGEAIAHQSGLRLLLLDRMDVLEPAARGDLLFWLDDMAAAGEIDTALVFATLKKRPAGLPDSITPYWIEAGRVAADDLLRRAA